jgi:hypothetical protein
MKLLHAIQLHKAFTPAQRKFIRARQQVGARPAADWVAHFADLARYDEIGDKIRRVVGIAFVVALCAGPALFVISNKGRNKTFVIAAVVMIGVALVVGLVRLILGRFDVPNRLREVVVPLLHVLTADADPRVPCQLRLDLRKSERKELATSHRRLQAPHPGSEATYRNPWLTVSWTTIDGVQCRLALVDLVRRRDTKRRSSSGKTKHKTKYKVKTLVQNAARAPVARFGVDKKGDARSMKTTGRDAKVAVVVRPGPRRHVIKSKLTLVHRECDGPVDPQAVLTAVAAAFASLTPPAAAGETR